MDSEPLAQQGMGWQETSVVRDGIKNWRRAITPIKLIRACRRAAANIIITRDNHRSRRKNNHHSHHRHEPPPSLPENEPQTLAKLKPATNDLEQERRKGRQWAGEEEPADPRAVKGGHRDVDPDNDQNRPARGEALKPTGDASQDDQWERMGTTANEPH